MTEIRAWSVLERGGPFAPSRYTLPELDADQVEIEVQHCGLCHSDLSLIDDAWGISQYPLVPGHEVVGRVVARGERVPQLTVGQTVGVGWTCASCMHCRACLSGRQQLCAQSQPTAIGRPGGFAERIRAHWAWAIPIPDTLPRAEVAPLFCAGLTVFEPIAAYVRPTDRVGVVGIGGLGHLALKLLRAWGCEVIAFTRTSAQTAAARALGAHAAHASDDARARRAYRGRLDLLLVTVNVPLAWSDWLTCLAPEGRLHVVGAVLEPMAIAAFDLIGGQRSVSGSPIGSPNRMADLLAFCARHGILPENEHLPLEQIDIAVARLRRGGVGHRLVLDHPGSA